MCKETFFLSFLLFFSLFAYDKVGDDQPRSSSIRRGGLNRPSLTIAIGIETTYMLSRSKNKIIDSSPLIRSMQNKPKPGMRLSPLLRENRFSKTERLLKITNTISTDQCLYVVNTNSSHNHQTNGAARVVPLSVWC